MNIQFQNPLGATPINFLLSSQDKFGKKKTKKNPFICKFIIETKEAVHNENSTLIHKIKNQTPESFQMLSLEEYASTRTKLKHA